MRKIRMLYLFLIGLVTLVASDCNTATIVGSIQANVGGGDTFIAQTGGTKVGGIRINGNALTVEHDRRLYLAGTCANDFGPNIFKSLMLLDKTFSFTADLSQVGCGCNAALYLVAMPAYNQQNQPDPTKCGDYYCDANNVCGVYCPEMDIFEANNRALAVTPHRCSAPQGKYYPSCDRGGCGLNTYRMNNQAYGPGGNFIINTQSPFRVSMSFTTSGGSLNNITTVLSQNGKTYRFMHGDSNCGGGYLESLTDAFKQGFVVAISYWGDLGSGMSWLDVPPCNANQNCNTDTTVTFSDIAVT